MINQLAKKAKVLIQSIFIIIVLLLFVISRRLNYICTIQVKCEVFYI
jgi:hypothetical protein